MFSFLNDLYSKRTSRDTRIYLDYAAATPISSRAKALLSHASDVCGNPSSIYKEGVEAKHLLKISREKIAKILSCQPYEIYFTGSGTESISLALNGTVEYWHSTHIGTDILPHIITTNIEHPAVLETLRNLERQKKAKVTYVPVDENGIVAIKHIRESLTPDTILVSIMYVNNEIGTIQPVKEIGRMLAEYRESLIHDRADVISKSYPYFHIDACQAANYLPVDTKSLRADMMTLNSSKVYGPKGIGLLFKREAVMLLPLILGGGQERGLRSGTEAVPLVASFAEAFVEASELRETEAKRLLDLRSSFIKELKQAIPDVAFYGTFEDAKRVPNNINCRIPKILSEEVILRLDSEGFAVSHKSACASESESGSHVILALGGSPVEASENIRITMGRATTENDMKKLVQKMQSIAEMYRK